MFHPDSSLLGPKDSGVSKEETSSPPFVGEDDPSKESSRTRPHPVKYRRDHLPKHTFRQNNVGLWRKSLVNRKVEIDTLRTKNMIELT